MSPAAPTPAPAALPALTLLPPSHPPANRLFPLFVKIEERRVLLVGAGHVGLEKLTALLRHGPATAVTVVAPRQHPELVALAARHPWVRLVPRTYNDTDLDGHDLVFVATDDPALGHRIRAAAARQRLLVNVADTPAECDFYLGAVVSKGDLKIAISTNGRSPTLGKRLRDELDDALPPALPALAASLSQVRARLRGPFAQKVSALNALTAPLSPEARTARFWRRVATAALAAFGALLVVNVLLYYFSAPQLWTAVRAPTTLYLFAAVGFAAQFVDGLLGMGYGVVAAISLLSAGVSPAAVSASIHTAEMFASGASGYQHYRFGNVNRRLFRVLVVPGVAGAVAGAWLLSRFGLAYAGWLKPLLAVYLLLLGARILSRAFGAGPLVRRPVRHAGWLAGAGGFLDSFGGGGWGPLVTSTFLSRGRSPRYVIGTVSLTEFFVTFASALTFFATLGIGHWQVMLGLIVGGVAAAPLAARLAGRLPARTMLRAVGLMAMLWSVWTLGRLVVG